VAGYEAQAAVRDALVGNLALAKQQAQAALALSRCCGAVAIALGLAGDSAQATRLAYDLAKWFQGRYVLCTSTICPRSTQPRGLRGSDAGKVMHSELMLEDQVV